MSAQRDWRSLDLGPGGRSLIEASAGTGKTWTISVLYLRLLLEQRLTPRQIVVSTFTNAAADELRDRLRGRLDWALAWSRSARLPAAGDSDQAYLRARWDGKEAQRREDGQRLQLALSELDLAPVSTLHRLCSRILADHPFAAGTPFRPGELVNGDALVGELADDLWRLIAMDPEWALRYRRACPRQDLRRGALRSRIACLLAPDVRVPFIDEDELRRVLPREWAGRLRAICDQDGYFRADSTLRRHWRLLAELIEQGLDAEAGELRTSVLEGAPGHNSLSAAGKRSEEVQEAARFTSGRADFIAGLKANAVPAFWAGVQRWARAQLRRRLDAAHRRSFDDLLSTVYDALQRGPQGRRLADALHEAWPVALIDEFQDTDPVQYGILDAIHRDAGGAARGRLVLIGDPKQAIYRFRGGDIHTYERAGAAVDGDGRLSLSTNQRSSREYVQAVNAFYAAAGGKLGSDDSPTPIRYHEVEAAGRADRTPYRQSAAAPPCPRPLVLHLLHEPGLQREAARFEALRACANQVAALLSDEQQAIGDRRLLPSDIAVLLPANAQVATLQRLLRERGVPCVAASRSSVFGEPVARELLVLLHAVVHCDDPALLRAALATRLWGASYPELRQLDADPAAWQEVAHRFHAWRAQWQALGVHAVVDALVERIAPAQLATREGERVLTDLRHLGELLQDCADTSDGMESVLAWLRRQVTGDLDPEEDAGDARALRIESDARRVQVMTLHLSKGLEFNIVFLPLLWAQGDASEKGLPLLGDATGQGRSVVFSSVAKDAIQRDRSDERHRLLYVALTRAAYACHVFAVPPGAAALSKEGTAGVRRPALEALLLEHGLVARLAGCERVELRHGWSPGGVVTMRHAPELPLPRRARVLPSAPRGPLPARHSFTTLVSAAHGVAAIDPEQSALDESGFEEHAHALAAAEAVPGTRTPHPVLDELAGIAGADFGNAVHAIFEHRQPGVPLAGQPALVLRALAEFNVQRPDLDRETLAARLAPRLQAVLDAELGGAGGPCLGLLPARDLRAELEFNYALDGASLARLRSAAECAGDPRLVPASQRRLAGLMNGKIDLVFRHEGRFHVLDYKGNRLGQAAATVLEDYAGDALEQAMDKAHYRFQALLYVVAVERHLRQRLGAAYQRARHLGDCWYLFVRAAGLSLPDGTPCGVWRHRFPDALLDAVQEELARSASSPGEPA